MIYNEYVELMSDRPYTEPPMITYKRGWGALLSRVDEWPYIVSKVDPMLDVVKLSPYRLNKDKGKYVRVTGFDPSAFKENEQVTDIIMHRCGQTIVTESFSGCTGLKRITIPKCVKRIEENAFKSCDSLEDVYYEGTLEEWRKIDIVSEKYEVEFGEFYPGTPVQKIKSATLRHIPGNEALFRATIHFNCDLDEMIPHGNARMLHSYMKGKMSVRTSDFEKWKSGRNDDSTIV